jgi:hypothetical protein
MRVSRLVFKVMSLPYVRVPLSLKISSWSDQSAHSYTFCLFLTERATLASVALISWHKKWNIYVHGDTMCSVCQVEKQKDVPGTCREWFKRAESEVVKSNMEMNGHVFKGGQGSYRAIEPGSKVKWLTLSLHVWEVQNLNRISQTSHPEQDLLWFASSPWVI